MHHFLIKAARLIFFSVLFDHFLRSSTQIWCTLWHPRFALMIKVDFTNKDRGVSMGFLVINFPELSVYKCQKNCGYVSNHLKE